MKKYLDMNYIEKLDWALKWFTFSPNAKPHADITRLFNDINEQDNYRHTQSFGNIKPGLEKIINRLEKDGYIESKGTVIYIDDTDGAKVEWEVYTNTLDGNDFLTLGGYDAAFIQSQQLELDRKTQRELTKANHKLQIQMNWLTSILAVSALVQIIYYLWDMSRNDKNPVLSINLLTSFFLFVSGTLTGIAILLIAKEVWSKRTNS